MGRDIDLESFIFSDGGADNAVASGLTVVIPKNLRSKDDVLRTYQRLFKFPYFGMNWDALQDCLRDLSWLGEEKIVIIHEDLPALSEADLKIYLTILTDTAKEWKDDPLRQLSIRFPKHLRDQLSKID